MQPSDTTTSLIVDRLTSDELLPLLLAVQLGDDVRHLAGYEKAQSLFQDDGQIHPACREFFLSYAQQRLTKRGRK